jgi:ribosomal protein S18 acetylase RimI-like enzyme
MAPVRQDVPMADEIVLASTASDYEAFGGLIREYWEWLQARYADLPGFIDAVGGHQALDSELNALAETYGPPEGKTLLAVRAGQVCGAIAFHDLHDGSCEMKRLYVPARFQGQGTGRQLCEALLDKATDDGYLLMRLDTGYQNAEALAMYESLGFRECAPYHEYPADLLTHLRFMEKQLATDPKA